MHANVGKDFEGKNAKNGEDKGLYRCRIGK